MKKILFVLALFGTGTLSAQTIENENVKAQKEMEKKGYFGHVDYKMDQIHTININYSISPKVPTSEVDVTLHTSIDRPIGLYVANSQGKKLVELNPDEKGYIKKGKLNVSSLKAGKYTYVIYWDKDTVLEIPFEKK